MSNVTVVYYAEPNGTHTREEIFRNADIHLSTHGVLAVRESRTNKTIRAYSAGTWHTARVS